MMENASILRKTSPKISWEEFEQEHLTREDAYKYEWVDGRVERTLRFTQENAITPENMSDLQIFIVKNILESFTRLKYENSIKGMLIPEVDTFFDGKHRCLDIAYFTDKQVEALRKGNRKNPPQFVIEIIFNSDQMTKVQAKMANYRAAKVSLVWHIFPELQEVHIYEGKQMRICTDKG